MHAFDILRVPESETDTFVTHVARLVFYDYMLSHVEKEATVSFYSFVFHASDEDADDQRYTSPLPPQVHRATTNAVMEDRQASYDYLESLVDVGALGEFLRDVPLPTHTSAGDPVADIDLSPFTVYAAVMEGVVYSAIADYLGGLYAEHVAVTPEWEKPVTLEKFVREWVVSQDVAYRGAEIVGDMLTSDASLDVHVALTEATVRLLR